jgi:hypothetical protein
LRQLATLLTRLFRPNLPTQCIEVCDETYGEDCDELLTSRFSEAEGGMWGGRV